MFDVFRCQKQIRQALDKKYDVTQTESGKDFAENQNDDFFEFFSFFCLQYAFSYVTRSARQVRERGDSVRNLDIKHNASLALQGSAEFNI